MKVDKLVIQSIISTLGAIAILFAFMVLSLICFFPSTMMEITYDLGLDESSIGYAERAYDWSGDEYFIAYAMEVAVGIKDTEKIDACGEKLIADSEFAQYCQLKNQSLPEGITLTYEQYVYGQVCVAKYKNGQKTEAVERAVQLLEGFPKDNALVAVLYSALAKGDVATISSIEVEMLKLNRSGFTQEEKDEFQRVLEIIDQFK